MSGARAAARALVPLLAVFGGCAGLHSSAQPEQTYYLRAHPAVPAVAAAPLAVSLRVGHPAADPGLDSPHIMLVLADHRMNFFSGSRWPAPAPDMIEALVVATLRASGEWAVVEDSASPFPADYLLQPTVRRFEADYSAGAAPRVEVVLDCAIGRRAANDVIATFTASGSAPAQANRLGDVVTAFEQAGNAALAQLAQQAAEAVRADMQRPPP